MSRVCTPPAFRREIEDWFRHFGRLDVQKGYKLKFSRWAKEVIENGGIEILYQLKEHHDIPPGELLECIAPDILACFQMPPAVVKKEQKLRGKRQRRQAEAILNKSADLIGEYWSLQCIDRPNETAKSLRELARRISKSPSRPGMPQAVSITLVGVETAKVIIKHLKKKTDPFPYSEVGRLIKVAFGHKHWNPANPGKALKKLVGDEVKRLRKESTATK